MFYILCQELSKLRPFPWLLDDWNLVKKGVETLHDRLLAELQCKVPPSHLDGLWMQDTVPLLTMKRG
ncbi:hypothetical protein WJX79_007561 [Trebouxia sp. C0005]